MAALLAGMAFRAQKGGFTYAGRDFLAAGGCVPDDARRAIAKPFAPAWLFRLVAGGQWRKVARRNGIADAQGAHPYVGGS